MKEASHRPPNAPLRTPTSWSLVSSKGHLPNSTFEPTQERYVDHNTGINWLWSSRAHRKGIPPVPDTKVKGDEEKSGGAGAWKVERRRIRWIGNDFNDISWWIAVIFTIGSVWWCINAILSFGYFTNSTNTFLNTESAFGFLGGTTFWIGAYLGWVESINPTRDADFGWEIDHLRKTLVEPEPGKQSLGRSRHHFGKHHRSSPLPSPALNSKPESDKPSSPSNQTAPTSSNVSSSETVVGSDDTRPKWKWFGYHPSLGYIANTIQFFGATCFQISVICGLPGVLPSNGSAGGPEQTATSEGLWIALYWGMQVIGSPCFTIAGAMFCWEVQDRWWKPKPLNLGWQVGFWNLIGGFGFWFCGIFGIWRQTSIGNPELYQYWGTAFSNFWGSWAFLIGSYLQLWETINKKA